MIFRYGKGKINERKKKRLKLTQKKREKKIDCELSVNYCEIFSFSPPKYFHIAPKENQTIKSNQKIHININQSFIQHSI